jgi:tartrate-resistant acid phosphatase type 5
LQWPFEAWGATAVFAGHDHIYERISVGGFPYFVCGASGANLYPIGTPIAGSQVAFNADFGAMLVSATELRATVRFVTRTGVVVDTFTILPDVPYPR